MSSAEVYCVLLTKYSGGYLPRSRAAQESVIANEELAKCFLI